MSLKLIAKKTHIVHKNIQGNGKTSHIIEKGQIFTIFVKHITKYDKDGELVSVCIYHIKDGWIINFKNFTTKEKYIAIKRQDILDEILGQ
jgi:hypothetical protein